MKATLWNEGWTSWTDRDPAPAPVTLPHDAMMCSARRADAAGGDAMGYFDGDVYRYEKRFQAPKGPGTDCVQLRFDGVYRNATVSLNGVELARHAYGYTPFTVDLAPALIRDGENVLTVVADNSKLPCSRWYSGGGIYRDVWLLSANERHIPWQGVRVDTISTDPARIRVRMELAGEQQDGDLSAALTVSIEILDGTGVLACAEGCDVELELPGARPWSDTDPKLYTCRATLREGSQVLDRAEVTFGVRTLSWSPEGLFVNGKRTLLRGACIHHDNGVIGAISAPESEERRVRILKKHGFNALRISHNPASTALLEACDRLGMYVMDETFDMWFQHKSPYDYAADFDACYLDDTRAMVERDRTHPSVIMYSIGNEVSEPARERGMQVARDMVNLVRSLDPTRPVTAGINFMVLMMAAKGKGIYDEGGVAKAHAEGSGGATGNKKGAAGAKGAAEQKSGSLIFNTMMTVLGKGMNRIGNSKAADAATSPVLELLDISGYNYASGRYVKEQKLHPGRIIVGSETFPQDIYDNWRLVERLPYLIGDFMWTGWDYLGEAAIGAWSYDGTSMANVSYPWLLAGAGAIDITGRADAQAAYASTVWNTRTAPYIGVRPANHPGVRVTRAAWRGTDAFDSWSWSGCEGNRTVVEVYARAATVELVLNGKKLGRKRLKKHRARYSVRYEPGRLEAIVYDVQGAEIGRSALVSATGDPRLVAAPESDGVAPGQLAYVSLEIQGANGVMESNADRALEAQVSGGELVGFGSAQPNPLDGYRSGRCRTWYGHALAVIRADGSGPVELTVRDETGQVARTAIALAE